MTPERPGDIVVNESAAPFRRHRDRAASHVHSLPGRPVRRRERRSGSARATGPRPRRRHRPPTRRSRGERKREQVGQLRRVGDGRPPAWWAAEPDVYRYGAGVAASFAPGADIDRVKADVVQSLRPPECAVRDRVVRGRVDRLRRDQLRGVGGACVRRRHCPRRVAAPRPGTEPSSRAGEQRRRPAPRAGSDSRATRALASGLRWTVTGIVAAVTAVATMFAASPLAPIGVARKTIEHAHVDLDGVVGSLIAIATVVAIALGGAWSAWRIRSRTSRVPSSSLAIHAVRPAAATGIAATLGSLRRPLRTNSATALGAIVLVAAAAIATAALVHSYDRLLDRPPQFGAPWDAVVGNNSSPEEAAQVAARLSGIDGIDGAAGIVDLDGSARRTRGVPIVAFVAAGELAKTIEPAITDGRAPTAPGEIALGAVTMRHLGLGLGDKVRLEIPDTKVGALRVRVVGRALLEQHLRTRTRHGRSHRRRVGTRPPPPRGFRSLTATDRSSDRGQRRPHRSTGRAETRVPRVVQRTDPEYGPTQPRPNPTAPVDTRRNAGAARRRRRAPSTPRVRTAPPPRARRPARDRVHRSQRPRVVALASRNPEPDRGRAEHPDSACSPVGSFGN